MTAQVKRPCQYVRANVLRIPREPNTREGFKFSKREFKTIYEKRSIMNTEDVLF